MPAAVQNAGAPPPRIEDRRKSLAMKLTVLARQMWLSFDQRAEKIGLSRAKWSLVVEVARNPGATQRSIAAKLQVTDVTAGRLIDRLCSEGYLERHEDPDDRRAYRVYPTQPAMPMLAQLDQLSVEHSSEAFAGFSEDDLSRLEAYLDAISRNVSSGRGKA